MKMGVRQLTVNLRPLPADVRLAGVAGKCASQESQQVLTRLLRDLLLNERANFDVAAVALASWKRVLEHRRNGHEVDLKYAVVHFELEGKDGSILVLLSNQILALRTNQREVSFATSILPSVPAEWR
jgi:hypothetical protein